MALPVLQFNTATGSDTQASGAGPATAIFGTTNAATDATGLVVTLPAGTDLTNVAIDGSHLIFLNDATAGARNFGKITAKAGSGGATPTVSVPDAFGLSQSGKSWAIGGKRNTIASASSLKLFDNNGTNGDAMPGWVMELEGGQTHSFTTSLSARRSGNSTDGPITVRTAAGYSARAILTWNTNANAISIATNCGNWHYEDLELQNTNATKTSAFAINSGSPATTHQFLRIKCAHATNKFGRFMNATASAAWRILGCEVGYCTLTNALSLANFTSGVIIGCWFHDNAGLQTVSLATSSGLGVLWNVFTNNAGNAIGSTSLSAGNGLIIIGNTIDGSTGDGINVGSSGSVSFHILNNLITNCTGAAVDFGTDTAERLRFNNTVIDGNNTFNNGGGSYVPSGYGTNDPGVNPGYVNPGALDWSVGAAMANLAVPLTAFPGTTFRSYMDIGAAQRQATSGSSAAEISVPFVAGV